MTEGRADATFDLGYLGNPRHGRHQAVRRRLDRGAPTLARTGQAPRLEPRRLTTHPLVSDIALMRSPGCGTRLATDAVRTLDDPAENLTKLSWDEGKRRYFAYLVECLDIVK
jgi:hypothetical protein